MAAVTHAAPRAAAPQAVRAWLDTLPPIYTGADRERFAAAYAMAEERIGDAKGGDGEALVSRALGTAGILAAQRLDPDSLTASLLIGLPASARHDPDAVVAAFGGDVAALVEGVARMNAVQALAVGADAQQRAVQAENLRKMLLAMVEDIRVVLIKLAE
jgi:(p)ppGpp synthase/HD superfamily hydrolase